MLIAAPAGLSAQTGGAADRVDPAAPTAAASTALYPLYQPLTGAERWKNYGISLISPVALAGAAVSAGIGQWKDRPKEWKEGDRAYGYRVASAYGEHFVNQTLASGFAAAFGEDNRYFASGQTGFGPRLGYALESTFAARHADGSRHLSYSKIVGFVGAASLSRLWQPDSTRTVRSGGLNLVTTVGVSAGFNVAREFIPRVFHTRQ